MAAASSAIDVFRRELDKYNTLHVGFPDQYSKFIKDIDAIENASAIASKLPGDTISRVVEKIAKYKELGQKLKGVSPEIQGVLERIQGNNSNLARLKLEIETAITSAQLAAEKKADYEAKTAAAEKAALDKARAIIDKEIAHLTQFKTSRQQEFENTLSEKNLEVTRLNQEITSKNDEITSKIAGKDYISDETRDIVKGITDDISTFIVANDFTHISADINTRGLETLGKFDEIIEKLQQVKNGTDIDAMKTAVSGINSANVLPSMELEKIIKEESDEFIRKLQAKRDDVLSKANPVTVAIQRDQSIAEMIQEANTLNKPEAQEFKDKLTRADGLQNTDTNSSKNTLLGSILGNANGSLSRFEQKVSVITEKFKNLNEELSKSGIAVSKIQSDLKKTIVALNGLYQVENAKYKSLHAKFEANNDKFEANNKKLPASQERPSSANSVSSISSVNSSGSGSVSPTVSPRSDLKPRPPLTTNKRPFAGRQGAAAAAARNASSPTEAWLSSALPSLSPPPGVHTESPDRQSSKLLGPKERYLFMPRNKKGKTGSPEDILSQAILVEIPADSSSSLSPKSLDGSRRGGKRKHLQRGGAPPPSALPPESEIRIIYDYTPGIFDLITGLTPPNILLGDTSTSEENTDHPTIAKIRNGIPIVDQTDKQRIYDAIKQFLITKESKNPLDIGRKAVYKVNILKLLRLLEYVSKIMDFYGIRPRNI